MIQQMVWLPLTLQSPIILTSRSNLHGSSLTTSQTAFLAASQQNEAGATKMISKANKQAGFTLVELTAAMVASTILIIGFSSVIVFSRQQLTDTATRVGLGYDQVLIDKYIRTKLTSTISDSMKIYPNAMAEGIDSTSTSGTILRAVDADSTVYHLELSSGMLVWMVDSTLHQPVDCIIDGLTFSERTGSSTKNLTINMNLCSNSDTIAAEWSITLRN